MNPYLCMCLPVQVHILLAWLSYIAFTHIFFEEKRCVGSPMIPIPAKTEIVSDSFIICHLSFQKKHRTVKFENGIPLSLFLSQHSMSQLRIDNRLKQRVPSVFIHRTTQTSKKRPKQVNRSCMVMYQNMLLNVVISEIVTDINHPPTKTFKIYGNYPLD